MIKNSLPKIFLATLSLVFLISSNSARQTQQMTTEAATILQEKTNSTQPNKTTEKPQNSTSAPFEEITSHHDDVIGYDYDMTSQFLEEGSSELDEAFKSQQESGRFL